MLRCMLCWDVPTQLGVVAFHVENNDSQLFGVTKKEYLRVLTNIITESDSVQARPWFYSTLGKTCDGRFCTVLRRSVVRKSRSSFCSS